MHELAEQISHGTQRTVAYENPVNLYLNFLYQHDWSFIRIYDYWNSDDCVLIDMKIKRNGQNYLDWNWA